MKTTGTKAGLANEEGLDDSALANIAGGAGGPATGKQNELGLLAPDHGLPGAVVAVPHDAGTGGPISPHPTSPPVDPKHHTPDIGEEPKVGTGLGHHGRGPEDPMPHLPPTPTIDAEPKVGTDLSHHGRGPQDPMPHLPHTPTPGPVPHVATSDSGPPDGSRQNIPVVTPVGPDGPNVNTTHGSGFGAGPITSSPQGHGQGSDSSPADPVGIVAGHALPGLRPDSPNFHAEHGHSDDNKGRKDGAIHSGDYAG